MNFVLDTNIVLYLLGGRLAGSLPSGTYHVSVITELELLSYPDLDEDSEKRIRELLSSVAVVDLAPEVRMAAIQLRRTVRLKLPDAIIAATAQALGAELLTNDAKLSGLAGLKVRAVPIRH